MKLKKIILSLTLISSLLVGCDSNSDQKSIDTNQSNKIEQTSKDAQMQNLKISVASVAISEVLDAMNQEIVGRPTTKLNLPEKYVNVEEIGSSFSPDFEKILAVGTELLIADETFKNKIEKTANTYNINTFYVNTSTYKNFIDSIKTLGEKINKIQEANDVIKKIQEPIDKYKDKTTDKKVAIIFGTSESNMLATDESYVGSLIKALGGKNIVNEIIEKNKNILENSENGYINLNLEQVIENQPDIIIRFGHNNIEEYNKSFDKLFNENPAWKNLNAIKNNKIYNKSFDKLFNENPAWKNLNAIKNNKIYNLDSSIFGVSANLKIDIALKQLGEILYEK